ncbi:hypothetical protein IK112_02275 [Candidatus Saccharibacteria bacterium]|nr:hypothetical protein [Candidatus Saccharibacteria bacterium]
MEFFAEFLKSFYIESRRNFINELHEEDMYENIRLAAFHNACAESDGMVFTYNEMEENRIRANENMEICRRDIYLWINIGTRISMIYLVFFILLFPTLTVGLCLSLIFKNLLILVGFVVAIAGIFITELIMRVITLRQIGSAYYDYGYAEAVVQISDTRSSNAVITPPTRALI